MVKLWKCWNVELLNCWIVEMLNCWKMELLNCWIVELLNCWIVEVLKCWSVEVLKCWIVKLLNVWIVELLNIWIFEFLNCWLVELLNCWMLNCRFVDFNYATLVSIRFITWDRLQVTGQNNIKINQLPYTPATCITTVHDPHSSLSSRLQQYKSSKDFNILQQVNGWAGWELRSRKPWTKV